MNTPPASFGTGQLEPTTQTPLFTPGLLDPPHNSKCLSNSAGNK